VSDLQPQRWLKFLEKKLGWLAVPGIALLFVTLQALGFLCILSDQAWYERLALVPEAVKAGEYWRLLTFLALPLSLSPLWLFFALWFLYFTINLIESQWGSFRTTLYVLVSIIVTITFSLIFNFPVGSAQDFVSSLFLASAALFPNLEIRVYFAIPVKMKFLGWLALGWVVVRFAGSNLYGRLYLLAIYSNYLVFFGPAVISSLKAAYRRWSFRRKLH
jgi:membrane associated rhomboid family serine protease